MNKKRYTDEFLANLRDGWAGAGFQRGMARLESIRARGRGTAAWKEGEGADALHRLVQDATVMSFMVERIHIEAGPSGRPPAEAAGWAGRLAGVWEGLSEVCHPEQAEWFAFDAACAYELAGVPEGARRMAKLAGTGRAWDGGHGLRQAAALLLQRRFARLRSYCEPIAGEPDYEKVRSVRYSLALASAAGALSDFAGSMLSGSAPDMDGMDEDLDNAHSLFYLSGFHDESCVACSIRSLLGTMRGSCAGGGAGLQVGARRPGGRSGGTPAAPCGAPGMRQAGATALPPF